MNREWRKTALLFSLAVLLGLIAYWTVEVPTQQQLAREAMEKALYDQEALGQLRAIQLPRADLQNDQGQWMVQGRDASPQSMQELLELFSQLQVVRRIETMTAESEQEVFPADITLSFSLIFEHGKLQLELGAKSKVDDSFYIKLKHGDRLQWLLVRDGSLQEEALTEEMYRLNPMKYNRLRAMLMKERDFFDDKALFNEMEKQRKILAVSISTFRNRSFQIDALKKSTKPETFGALKTDALAIDDYLKKFKELQALAVFRPIRQELLKRPLGEIRIQYEEGEPTTLQLFQDYGQLRGFFLTVNQQPFLLEFSHTQVPMLMPSLQQFWDRRPFAMMQIQHKEAIKEADFDIQFPQAGIHQLRIPANDRFLVERKIPGAQPIHQSFAQLFGLMYSPAERVSLLDTLERKEIQDIVATKSAALQLQFHDQQIRVEEVEGELRVINLTEGLIFHYPEGAEHHHLGLRPQDYFLY